VKTTPRFIVHRAILEGKAPVYVAHRRDGWFVAAKGFVDEPKTRFRKLNHDIALRKIPELTRFRNLPLGFAAYRHRRSDGWTVEALPRGETYLVTYEARPAVGSSNAPNIGGGFVNCWIRSTSRDQAKRKAREHVRSNGWNIVRLMTANRTRANNLNKAAAPYFRQAQIDGWVCIFHTFPVDASDA